MSIADNIARIRERMANAASRSGRMPGDVVLMAVSKIFSPAAIREAYDAGVRLFGENRVQEFAGKAPALHDLNGAQFHLIGHLQSNKAARAAELFSAIDSVDSIRLAERLNAAAQTLNRKLEVLIEINIGGEEAKSGLAPDSQELQTLLGSAQSFPSLRIRGLMCVPPHSDDPDGARPHFHQMRALRERIRSQNLPSASMEVLSMGMTHDFEVAIEEGSTCVRLGTAIFGERKKG